MLIPIRHENMTARRWPVITLGLIALNVIVFLGTQFAVDDEQQQHAREVKAHILMLAAMHTELTMPPQVQELVKNFQEQNPKMWAYLKDGNRDVADGWDAKVRLMNEQNELQSEMDSLAAQYSEAAANPSLLDRYAFVPGNIKPLSYLTANFLHGGWLHLIGNMWFLWLAGFILEDLWGRPLYTIFYVIAGAAALQVHAWTNANSMVPTLGASGAVAGLMGAFLVRFPKMKIEMRWILGIRSLLRGGYQFSAPAWALLPLWLLMEIFYGSLIGHASGVAHWAHVGGFAFGVLIAMAVRYTGLEHLANKAIEEKVSLAIDPETQQASELIAQGRDEEAIVLLRNQLAAKPDAVDACSLLQQTYWRKGDMPAFHELTAQLCALHLKARENDLAWQNYVEFLNTGGKNLPVGTWFDLCRLAESKQEFELAIAEYRNLAAAYPDEKRSLQALIAAGRICLKQLNRPDEALKFYESAKASPIPHLDWEQTIEAAIREAKKNAAAPQLAGAK